VLVPHFLAVGAAMARVVAMVVMVITTFVLGQRLWPQQPDFRALAKLSGWAVALYLVAQLLPDGPLVLVVPAKALLALALVVLAVWSGALDRDDVRNAWSWIAGRLRQWRTGSVEEQLDHGPHRVGEWR
jgi:O-antigen/teichoic acid export membrane protein